ncbi:ABC transporter ATP-binding protein [Magnetofaba australis]|uniref:Putative ABC transporter n=1 Tax=Magnetofaba australis IT-1 TaxID=1434232 RepID=A0A1Y2K146_9PROT|nr:ATP-binding cassette domain-containing protein [Magnetofaba australis]OSM01770.1 putative ABC transporter [Magnetofaba australis IT-1]
MSASLLEIRDLSMIFGGLTALSNVSFDVAPGSITALIGPNGAGKTTLFNCVTGFYKPTLGQMRLQPPGKTPVNLVAVLGEPLRATDFTAPGRIPRKLYFKLFGGSHRVARAGVARTFQNIRLFREMTVMENLLVAQHQQVNRNPIAGIIKSPGFRRSEREAIARAAYWLEQLDLADAANRLAGELPYGHQRRLEIARALCTGPKLICLDEPAAGLNPRETEALSTIIRRLRDEHGVTVFLIEHDMGLVMEISDHVVVLDHGEVIAQGKPDEVSKDPVVLEAYLGVEASAE